VDGKLIFDRDTNWFGHDALQTLEPRLYYVLTPYENQSDTPLFDTTALTFSYASLFRPNRFTGYDRIGDENRLTVGLTSRTIGDESGREWLRVSLGQVYFFDPRRVQLTDETVDESSTSAMAGELSTNPVQGLTARASFQWDPNLSQDQWEQRVLQLRYAPAEDRVVNFAYRYSLGQTEPERYENTDFSFRLPLSPRVGLVGRWLYSLLDSDTVDAYAGIEFGRCCWRLRILGRQLKTNADSDGNTSIMLQLELAGLGAVGNQIDKLLEQGIDGYELD
jgi:LPS-assembly protein